MTIINDNLKKKIIIITTVATLTHIINFIQNNYKNSHEFTKLILCFIWQEFAHNWFVIQNTKRPNISESCLILNHQLHISSQSIFHQSGTIVRTGMLPDLLNKTFISEMPDFLNQPKKITICAKLIFRSNLSFLISINSF